MPLSDPKLWKLIETWPLPYRKEEDKDDPPKRTCTRFEHNLRKIGDWTDEASVEITEAYRRFLYLKALTGETLTPPTCIDQAWHLHLGFKDDYGALEKALGRFLPHNASVSVNDSEESYVRGRALWASEFEALPKGHIWPSIEQIRVAGIGKPMSLFGFFLLIAGMVASISAGHPFYWLLVGGFVLFLSGGFIAGTTSPETVSRCG